MSWIRLDEDFPDHPKIIAAGPLAAWLHVKAIGYCNRYLTDGFVPRAKARTLESWEDVTPLRDAYATDALTSEKVSDHLIQRLVAAAMWRVVDGGYQIHDYLKFQPSREKVLAEREAERLRKERWRANKEEKSRTASDDCPEDVPPGQTAVSQPGPVLSVSDPVLFSLSSQSVDSSVPRSSDAHAHVGVPELGEAENAKQKRIVDKHVAAALRVLEELNAARKRVRPSCKGLRPTYSSLGGIAARLAAGRTPEECLHVIAVGEAECSRKAESFDWFDAVTPWRAENFEKRAGMDIATTRQETRTVGHAKPAPHNTETKEHEL
jgi:hypothetical protein